MIFTLQEVMDTCSNWDKFCDLKGFNPYAVNEGGGHVTVKLDPYEAHILGIVKLSEHKAEMLSKRCGYCKERVPKLAEICHHCQNNLLKKPVEVI